MSIVNGKELRGILLAVTGYLLVSAFIGILLGKWFLKWPFFLIPLGAVIFITSKFFANRFRLLNPDNYLGQTIHIVVTIFSYTIFTKSLFYYLDPIFRQYLWWFGLLGFGILIYTSQHYLKYINNSNG